MRWQRWYKIILCQFSLQIPALDIFPPSLASLEMLPIFQHRAGMQRVQRDENLSFIIYRTSCRATSPPGALSFSPPPKQVVRATTINYT